MDLYDGEVRILNAFSQEYSSSAHPRYSSPAKESATPEKRTSEENTFMARALRQKLL
jgi:hypothetical protein